MTRVLVTGATGVVGRLAIPQLVAGGYRVTAVGRTPERRAELTALGAEAIALDILDPAEVRRALAGHDVVVNLATHMPASLLQVFWRRSWRENDRVRRDGSANLVDAAIAAGVSRFVQESFAPVYEDGGSRWIDEGWPQRPVPYNRTVIDAERSAARFTANGGIGVVLRFAAFYGPDPFLRDMVRTVRRGFSPLPGRPDAYLSSVSHEDAAAAVVAALEAPAGAYNVTDDEPLERREWADALADAAGVRHPRLLPAWLTGLGGSLVELLSRSQRITNRKLKSIGGWRPRFSSAREGLRAAVARLPSEHEHRTGVRTGRTVPGGGRGI